MEAVGGTDLGAVGPWGQRGKVIGVRVVKMIAAAALLTAACQDSTSIGVATGRIPLEASIPTSTTPPVPTLVDLHTVAWAEVLPTLDGVSVDPNQTGGPGPYIAAGGASGFADLSKVSYEDLNTDGHDEAVIGLTTGVEMGGTGVIVLTATAGGPVLVPSDEMAASFGFGTRFEALHGEILVVYYVGSGWEPACCLSGQVHQRFRLYDGRMRLVAPPLEFGNPIAQGFTIDRYYSLLNARLYDAANQMLTDSARARLPSEPWMALFARSTAVKAEIGSNVRPDGLVPYRMLVTLPDGAGISTTQVWAGGYSLDYSVERNQWLLDWFSLQYESA